MMASAPKIIKGTNLYFALVIISFLAISSFFAYYLVNNYLKKPLIIKDNLKNNSKVYINDADGFNFEYPNSYKIKETVQEGNTLIDLERDQKWDNEGYYLEEGAWVRIIYKKGINSLKNYVYEENKNKKIKDLNIQEKTINSRDAFEVTYGNKYQHPLEISGISTVYLNNNNGILELSLQLGSNVTKAEYEQYLRDFNSIIESVKITH
jgi:hypothetical protein